VDTVKPKTWSYGVICSLFAYVFVLYLHFFPVAAGNRGVPDDLQKCHAMSKQLQQNQTDINQRLTVYDGQITNLTLQVSFIFMINVTRLLDHVITIIVIY